MPVCKGRRSLCKTQRDLWVFCCWEEEKKVKRIFLSPFFFQRPRPPKVFFSLPPLFFFSPFNWALLSKLIQKF